MEVGTQAEQLEAIAAEPNFLEIYADRELTVFGITGRLQDLAGMCPVDLNDPRVTQEAKNEFVVKVANESGMEIAPEHESYFSQVIGRHGQERKFTVAIPDNSHSPEQQSERQKVSASRHIEEPKARASAADQSAKQAPSEARKRKTAEPQIRQDGVNTRQPEREVDVAQKEVVPLNVGAIILASKLRTDASGHIFESTFDQPEAVVHFEANKKVAHTKEAVGIAVGGRGKVTGGIGQEARKTDLQPEERYVALAPTVSPEIVRPEMMGVAEDHEILSAGELPDLDEAMLYELKSIELNLLEEIAPELEDMDNIELSASESETEDLSNDTDELALPAVDQATGAMQPAESGTTLTIEPAATAVEQTTWNNAVEKEPLEFCDNFTLALQVLILESELAPDNGVAKPPEIAIVPSSSIRQASEEKPRLEPDLPMIAFSKVIAERLAELADEEKVTVAPVLKEIMVSVVDIKLLAEEAERAVVEEAMAQLEEAVVLLFDELGIACSTEEVEQFMHLLFSPGFCPPQLAPSEAVIDLRSEGTHEAKWHLAQLFTDSLDEVEYDTGQLLGKLALLYASSRNRSELVAA